jgi:hypothetical protein
VKQARKQAMGPRAVRGSEAARRQAALLLEVWSGVRTAQAASEAMGVAATRFYQLEARALQMMVSAMEPRPRGRQVTAEGELMRLRAERARLGRDVERYQSLYRTAQRTLGLAIAKPADKGQDPAPGGKRKRRPRRKARGESVAAALLAGAASQAVEAAEGVHDADGTAEQGSGARGRALGRSDGEAAAARDPRDAHA